MLPKLHGSSIEKILVSAPIHSDQLVLIITDRFQPPLTGFAAAHWSTASDWIVKLFKEAGA